MQILPASMNHKKRNYKICHPCLPIAIQTWLFLETSPQKGKRSLKTGGALVNAKKSKLNDALDTEEEGDNAGIKKEPDAPKGRKRGGAASGKSASKLVGGSSSSVSSDGSCRSPKRSRSSKRFSVH